MPSAQRCMAAFVLAEICNGYGEGQQSCLQQGLHRSCTAMIASLTLEPFFGSVGGFLGGAGGVGAGAGVGASAPAAPTPVNPPTYVSARSSPRAQGQVIPPLLLYIPPFYIYPFLYIPLFIYTPFYIYPFYIYPPDFTYTPQLRICLAHFIYILIPPPPFSDGSAPQIYTYTNTPPPLPHI